MRRSYEILELNFPIEKGIFKNCDQLYYKFLERQMN